jgi:predicted AAA+ superfamily ATPase
LPFLPKALWFDLLRTQTFLDLSRQPESFRQQVQAQPRGCWIVVDEVQRLPTLLNEVHDLIAEHGRAYRFALSGSSARKLKRFDVNLLAGRAINRQFFPLTAAELGFKFDLERMLRFGLLPQIHAEPDIALDTLEAYVANYLREEIQQEALVRRLDSFACASGIWRLCWHGGVEGRPAARAALETVLPGDVRGKGAVWLR